MLLPSSQPTLPPVSTAILRISVQEDSQAEATEETNEAYSSRVFLASGLTFKEEAAKLSKIRWTKVGEFELKAADPTDLGVRTRYSYGFLVGSNLFGPAASPEDILQIMSTQRKLSIDCQGQVLKSTKFQDGFRFACTVNGFELIFTDDGVSAYKDGSLTDKVNDQFSRLRSKLWYLLSKED